MKRHAPSRRPAIHTGLYLGAIALFTGVGVLTLCDGHSRSSEGAARSAAVRLTPAAVDTPHPGQGASPAGAPLWAQQSHVDWTDATGVGRAALGVMYTEDTVTDTSGMQAQLRAGPFLQPSYLAALKATPVTAPGAQWATWAAHHAYTTVQVTPGTDTRPTDTPVLAERQYAVVVTPIGRDGWRGASEKFTAFIELTRSSTTAPWHLAAVEISD